MAELSRKIALWIPGDVAFVIFLLAIKVSLAHDLYTTEKVINVFSLENGSDFRHILYNADLSDTALYIGGRDALYNLRVDNLHLEKVIPWAANQTAQESCRIKGYDAFNGCYNYVTVLLQSMDKDKLFICGSNAYDPVCTWRKADDLTQVLSQEFGELKSPFSSRVSTATYVARNGDFYFGSRFARDGQDPGFHRYSLQRPVRDRILRTPKNSLWMDDAHFVEIFEKEPFVYVFFREIAREFFSKQKERKPVYSRIARVCQNDDGTKTSITVQWATFQKARIECPVHKGTTFDLTSNHDDSFDQLQQIAVLTDIDDQIVTQSTVFAGIFNTPGHSIYGAALCLYEMPAIERIFAGSYQHQPTTFSTWQKDPSDYRSFNCSATKDSQGRNVTLLDARLASDPQLMFESVGPGIGSLFDKPVVIEEMTQFHFLQAERIAVHNNRFIYVFYVITGEKDIRKYVLDPSENVTRACIVAAWSSLFQPLENILTMKLLTKQQALVIGTSQRVVQLSSHACYEHSDERACTDSGDPHCGWHSPTQTCRSQPEDATGWTRSRLDNCHNNAIFPAWKEDAWYPCKEDGTNENCFCRSRRCIGSRCQARQFQITNCTRNGGWTEFSQWGDCSATCKENRTRSCTNPLPQFGGKNCTGGATEYRECQTGECRPRNNLRMALPAALPVMSGARFQDWGPWSECSRSCGRGTQRRTRACMNDSPTGKCDGPSIETKDCSVEDCPPMTKTGSWSMWTADGVKKGSEAFDEHRFQCVAVMNGTELEVNMKHEKRLCPNAGSCHSTRQYDMSLASSWSPWMECNPIGVQHRFYDCKGSQQRVCHAFEQHANDETSWGCWSDWSTCTNNEQSRFRICIKDSRLCHQGESQHVTRVCKIDDINDIAVAGSTMATVENHLIYLIIGCVLSFFAGIGVALSIRAFLHNRKDSQSKSSSSEYPLESYMERQPVQHNAYAPLPGHPVPDGDSTKTHDTDRYDNEEIQTFVPDPPPPFERGASKRSFRSNNSARPPPQRQLSSQKADQYYE